MTYNLPLRDAQNFKKDRHLKLNPLEGQACFISNI